MARAAVDGWQSHGSEIVQKYGLPIREILNAWENVGSDVISGSKGLTKKEVLDGRVGRELSGVCYILEKIRSERGEEGGELLFDVNLEVDVYKNRIDEICRLFLEKEKELGS